MIYSDGLRNEAAYGLGEEFRLGHMTDDENSLRKLRSMDVEDMLWEISEVGGIYCKIVGISPELDDDGLMTRAAAHLDMTLNYLDRSIVVRYVHRGLDVVADGNVRVLKDGWNAVNVLFDFLMEFACLKTYVSGNRVDLFNSRDRDGKRNGYDMVEADKFLKDFTYMCGIEMTERLIDSMTYYCEDNGFFDVE